MTMSCRSRGRVYFLCRVLPFGTLALNVYGVAPLQESILPGGRNSAVPYMTPAVPYMTPAVPYMTLAVPYMTLQFRGCPSIQKLTGSINVVQSSMYVIEALKRCICLVCFEMYS